MMQKPESLNADWSAVLATLSRDGVIRDDELVAAMFRVSTACADALRLKPCEPLTTDEQQILDDELEDDPRYIELLIRHDTTSNTTYVLEWYDKTVASAENFLAADVPDTAALADDAIMCWDHIVPEYTNHQLAHLAALIGSQLISRYPEFHRRTWLFRMSNNERWELFLGLAQQLDALESGEVKSLAVAIVVACENTD